MDIDFLEQLFAPDDGINSSIRPLPDLARRRHTYVQRVLSRVASVSFAHSTLHLSRNTDCRTRTVTHFDFFDSITDAC